MHKETTCRETREVSEQEKKTVHFVIRKVYLKAVTMYRQGSKKKQIWYLYPSCQKDTENSIEGQKERGPRSPK